MVSQFYDSNSTTACCSSVRSTSECAALNTNLEEADEKTIPHALNLVNKGIKSIIVFSPDTDVLVLMLYYWNYLQSVGLQELWIKAGVGDTAIFIPIHTVALRIGKELCQVLPAVHALTVWVHTSKVGTKLAALRANPTKYLQEFGLLTGSIDTQIAAAEEYLCQVIKKGTPYKTMNALRNFK